VFRQQLPKRNMAPFQELERLVAKLISPAASTSGAIL
jgi:hypothetical protein